MDAIVDARALVARHFGPTPLVRAASLSRDDAPVYLKDETVLPTGSFKVRGALYSLAVNVAARPIHEVVAASTGNHGAAVAYAAKLFGVGATIFVPIAANPVKTARIAEAGARVVHAGDDLSATIDEANAYADRSGAFFLHDAADPHVPDGAGTIGIEVVSELPAVEAIYVPMGDTALVRGVASAARRLKPSVRIVGVVAERAPVYARSWTSGAAEETATADTIADGLAVRRALAPNVAAIRALVDEVRLVSEDELLNAIAWLSRRERIVAEPAGAAATAAFLQARHASGTTVLLVTGRNIAPPVMASASALAVEAGWQAG